MAAYTYSGTWNGAQTPLVPAVIGSGRRTLLGTMTGFTTTNPRLACLSGQPSLDVFSLAGDPGQDWVVTRENLGDCATSTFDFSAPATPSTPSTTSPG